jgi:predicted  nucleic acid-binding Zn-ribbon protein
MTNGTPKQTLRRPTNPLKSRAELKLVREEVARYQTELDEVNKEAERVKKEAKTLKDAIQEETKQRTITVAVKQRKDDSELRALTDKITAANVELEERLRRQLKKGGNGVKLAAEQVEASGIAIKQTLAKSSDEPNSKRL